MTAPTTPTTPRPTAPAPILNNIPTELIVLEQWVNWRYEDRDGKATNVAYTPRASGSDLSRSKTNDPTPWSTFTIAGTCLQQRPREVDGIGFVFSAKDDFVGIDLDHCRDPE